MTLPENENPVYVPQELSNGWRDFVEAINLLSEGAEDTDYPTNCGHDTLSVSADPDKFSVEQLARLNELGFFPDVETGEGFMSFRFGSA